jgi:uncharacterized protein with NRDE domain
MCLILLALHSHPAYPLVFLANRDEFYERPSRPAAFWGDAPHVLAGRDLLAGGTWFGVTTTGRIAAVTNYRDPTRIQAGVRSRGELVSGFLTGQDVPADYLERVSRRGDAYNGFNLLVGTPRELYWYSNRGAGPRPLEPGIHGLSNHLLDTPWHKVRHGKKALREILSNDPDPAIHAFLALLADRSTPDDAELPETGVGPEWERILAPVFITSPTYGTRSSMVLLVDQSGTVTFVEKTFNGNPAHPSTVRHRFQIQRQPAGARAVQAEHRGRPV